MRAASLHFYIPIVVPILKWLCVEYKVKDIHRIGVESVSQHENGRIWQRSLLTFNLEPKHVNIQRPFHITALPR